MSSARRHNWGLIIDVLDVLEQHGYHQADDQHTGRAVGLIGDLARIYEGTQEAPAGAYVVSAPQPPQPSSDRPTPTATSNAETIAGAGIQTILAALDEASDYKREGAECCADCAGQSCGTCQYRLDAARTYEGLAARLMRAMEQSVAEKPSPQPTDSGPSRNRAQLMAAADREAGQ
jgi:ferredoxin